MAMLAAACAAPFYDDGTSVSIGTHAEGALRRGATLPPDGSGYTVPRPWRQRQSRYATDETVGWLVRSTRSVSRRLPGGVLPIGDLSHVGGGASVEHRSHESGRDVDIFFYALDATGRPLRPGTAMLRFGPDGHAMRWSPADGHPAPATPVPAARFDVRRNWALVRAMLTDPEAEVQWIFIHKSLAALLLQQGAVVGDDPALVARAGSLLHQPTDAQPHDDHMHVRLYCDAADRPLGCVDRGPQRWWKKRWKYMGGRARDVGGNLFDAVLRLFRGELPAGLRGGGLRS